MIRPANVADVRVMTDIYNEAIADEAHANCDDIQTDTDKLLSLYFSGDRRYAAFVKINNAGGIIGWGALKRFSARPEDDSIAEIAVYVARCHRSSGIGIHLLKCLISHAESVGFESLVAVIIGKNTPSIRGSRFCGFEECVRIPAIAELYGHYEDIVWMQKNLTQGYLS